MHWVRQAISRAIDNQAETIRVPTSTREEMRKLGKVELQLEQELDRKPNNQEIAEKMGRSVEKIVSLKTLRYLQPLSLESLLIEEDEGEGLEFGGTVGCSSFIDEIEKKENIERLRQALSCLSPREAEILSMRYGLEGEEPLTLKEVGDIFNLTRERIRQIEKAALKKLEKIY